MPPMVELDTSGAPMIRKVFGIAIGTTALASHPLTYPCYLLFPTCLLLAVSERRLFPAFREASKRVTHAKIGKTCPLSQEILALCR